MSSPAAAGDVLPALPPIKTAVPVAASAPEPSSALPSTAPDAKQLLPPPAAEETEPTTPTSEESKLRAPTECPPAPRKPAWTTPANRKSLSSSSPQPASARQVFFSVPRDLSAIFRSLPPKKRIRAG